MIRKKDYCSWISNHLLSFPEQDSGYTWGPRVGEPEKDTSKQLWQVQVVGEVGRECR